MSRVELGPLTTQYLPPPSCATFNVDVNSDDGLYLVRYGASCLPGSDQTSLVDEECFPSGLGKVRNSGANTENIDVYAPGISCPAGMVTACSMTRSAGPAPTVPAESAVWNILNPGETYVGCCPVGYECVTSSLGQAYCMSSVSSGDVLSGTSWDDNCKGTPATATVQTPVDVVSATGLRVNLIFSRGQQTIQPTPSPTAVAPGGRTMSTAMATASSKFGAADQSGAGNGGTSSGGGGGGGGSGLSNGAIIAIAVAVPVGVLLIASMLFCLWWRRRKGNRLPPYSEVGFASQSTEGNEKRDMEHSGGISEAAVVATNSPKGSSRFRRSSSNRQPTGPSPYIEPDANTRAAAAREDDPVARHGLGTSALGPQTSQQLMRQQRLEQARQPAEAASSSKENKLLRPALTSTGPSSNSATTAATAVASPTSDMPGSPTVYDDPPGTPATFDTGMGMLAGSGGGGGGGGSLLSRDRDGMSTISPPGTAVTVDTAGTATDNNSSTKQEFAPSPRAARAPFGTRSFLFTPDGASGDIAQDQSSPVAKPTPAAHALTTSTAVVSSSAQGPEPEPTPPSPTPSATPSYPHPPAPAHIHIPTTINSAAAPNTSTTSSNAMTSRLYASSSSSQASNTPAHSPQNSSSDPIPRSTPASSAANNPNTTTLPHTTSKAAAASTSAPFPTDDLAADDLSSDDDLTALPTPFGSTARPDLPLGASRIRHQHYASLQSQYSSIHRASHSGSSTTNSTTTTTTNNNNTSNPASNLGATVRDVTADNRSSIGMDDLTAEEARLQVEIARIKALKARKGERRRG